MASVHDDTSEHEYAQEETREERAVSAGTRQSVIGCFKWPIKKKAIWIVIGILSFLYIILSVIWFSVRNKPAADKSPTSPSLLNNISCPESWVEYEGKCYHFSSFTGTWDFSQRQCSSYGASLASIDTQQDKEFVMRNTNSTDHWVGLRRMEEGQPWIWTNGSIFSNWFNITAKGFCAYLNDKGASSTRCDNLQKWICTKSLQSSDWETFLDLPTTSLLDSGYQ